MRKRIALASLLAALLAAAIIALPATSHRAPNVRMAAMSGQEERPVPPGGDPDGYGAARFEILGRNICFRIIAREIETAVAGHIHRGARGEVGDIVVPLFEGDVPGRRRCVRARSRALAREIARFPERFYVNVHTPTFGNGAIRGQLQR